MDENIISLTSVASVDDGDVDVDGLLDQLIKPKYVTFFCGWFVLRGCNVLEGRSHSFVVESPNFKLQENDTKG